MNLQKKKASKEKSQIKTINTEEITVDQFLNWVESLEGNKIITISHSEQEWGSEKNECFSSAIEGDKWENPKESAWFLLSMRSCGIAIRHFLKLTYKESVNGKMQRFPHKDIFLFYKERMGKFVGCSREEATERGNTCHKTGDKLLPVKGDHYVSSLFLKIKEEVLNGEKKGW